MKKGKQNRKATVENHLEMEKYQNPNEKRREKQEIQL